MNVAVKKTPTADPATPADPLDHRPPQLVRDRSGSAGTGPPRIEDLGVEDRAPLHVGRELAANRLHLGKLRHVHNGSPAQPERSEKRAPRKVGRAPAGQPGEHARADIGHRSVVAAGAVAFEHREQRDVLSRVVGSR